MAETILQNLFNKDDFSYENNDIDKNLLNDFDKSVLKISEKNPVSEEVLNICKKFMPVQNTHNDANLGLFQVIRNFAKELTQQKKYSSALVLYKFLIVKTKLAPQDYYEICEVLYNLELPQLSEKFLKIYEKKEPNRVLAYITLGNFYNLISKDYKNAIKYYEKFLEIDKTKSSVYAIVANLYTKVYSNDGLQDSVRNFYKAYELDPQNRLYLHGLCYGYEKLGDKQNAKKFYQKLIKNNPTNTDFYNYGAFLISCGDFEQGHKYFRYRFLIDDKNNKYPSDIEKQWDFKTNIKDKTLLVTYEQGFGDTFMYCRFVPFLADCAQKVIFVVQDNLYDIIKNSPKISHKIEVISERTDLSKIKYDYNMALLDTPYVLKTNSDSIPYSDGYLEISDEKIKDYEEKYLEKDGKIRVGIAYKGDVNANYAQRDIDIKKFNTLTNMKGFNFYSLQYGEDEHLPRIKPLGNTFKNFTDTACAIKNMDLVISSDNVILNLSGALNVKTLGIFGTVVNYRWFKFDCPDTGWYSSVKPIRHDLQKDFDKIIDEIIITMQNIKNTGF